MSRVIVKCESLFAKLSRPGKSIDIVCIYRPPGNISTAFIDEFSDLLDTLTTTDRCIMICCDFNCLGAEVGTNDPSLSPTLTLYRLQQHVKCGTHEKGNVLDLLLTSSVHNLVSSVCVNTAGMYHQ